MTRRSRAGRSTSARFWPPLKLPILSGELLVLTMLPIADVTTCRASKDARAGLLQRLDEDLCGNGGDSRFLGVVNLKERHEFGLLDTHMLLATI